MLDPKLIENSTFQNMNRRGNLPNPNMQGIYANKSMCHALTALVGAKCTVRTKNEENTFEGFFHCFSPTMDIIVSAAHKVIGPISDSLNLTKYVMIKLICLG